MAASALLATVHHALATVHTLRCPRNRAIRGRAWRRRRRADDRLRRVAVLAGACVAAGARRHCAVGSEPGSCRGATQNCARAKHQFRRFPTQIPRHVHPSSSMAGQPSRCSRVTSCNRAAATTSTRATPRAFPSNPRAARTRGLACRTCAQRRGARQFRDLLAAQVNRSFAWRMARDRALGRAALPLRRVARHLLPAPARETAHAALLSRGLPAADGPAIFDAVRSRPSHPSLFVGPGRSQSSYYDSHNARFWMAVHEGARPSG